MSSCLNGNTRGTEIAEKEIAKSDRYFISLNPPEEFRSYEPDNIINRMDIHFENVCASMEEAGVMAPKKLSTFEFKQRVEFLNKKAAKSKGTN